MNICEYIFAHGQFNSLKKVIYKRTCRKYIKYPREKKLFGYKTIYCRPLRIAVVGLYRFFFLKFIYI